MTCSHMCRWNCHPSSGHPRWPIEVWFDWFSVPQASVETDELQEEVQRRGFSSLLWGSQECQLLPFCCIMGQRDLCPCLNWEVSMSNATSICSNIPKLVDSSLIVSTIVLEIHNPEDFKCDQLDLGLPQWSVMARKANLCIRQLGDMVAPGKLRCFTRF